MQLCKIRKCEKKFQKMFHAKKQLITTHGAAGEFENVLFSEKNP